MFSKIISTGSYLPNKIISYDDLINFVDTTDEWIYTRTGIKQRHVVEQELTSDLAVKSLEIALKKVNLHVNDLDGIIIATSTADLTFPATATIVQKKMNMKKGFAFDVQAVCAGFIYGLSVADAFIISGKARRLALIGAETFSKLLDWKDRNTCVLFGDGAGAVILESTNNNPKDKKGSGIIGVELFSDGAYGGCLKTTGGISFNQQVGYIYMNGKEVFKHAVNKLSEATDLILSKHNVNKKDISFLVPHQANIRIIKAIAKKLDLDMSKVITTVDKHANTSAASIPLALDYGYENHLFNQGDLLILEAIGGGLSWGSSLIRV